ncbi:MAG: amidase [Bdellovibrionales bacterium]|nr:amidase [Bdellovibrionales bacterium]
MSMDLCYLSASEALVKFKSKKLSPVELMKAVVAQIEKTNPKINALTDVYFEEALNKAKIAESKYAKNHHQMGPLEGIPLAIKDFHAVKDRITTFGSKIFKNHRSHFTAPTVKRLLDAGAIMHCRTTTPEFAYGDACHSPLWGITKNPWNVDYAPGGSSGGSAAAVASGMTTLADGTDGGGSIRIPASACGIVGYKPPFGRNPIDIDHPMEQLLVYGPLTRTVADAALMQNVMSGAHVDDACSLRQKVNIPSFSPRGLKGRKIAFSLDLGYLETDSEVKKNTLEALQVFRHLGCEIEQVEVGWSWRVYETWITYWQGIFAATIGDLLPNWRSEMDPFVVKLLENGLECSASDLYRCFNYRGEMYRKLAPILEKYDVLIVPTTSIPSVKSDHDCTKTDFKINGQVVPTYAGWVLTHGFNLISYCPVLSVPSGVSSYGVPTGIQIVGKSFDDLGVFEFAFEYEAVRPWAQRIPDI